MMHHKPIRVILAISVCSLSASLADSRKHPNPLSILRGDTSIPIKKINKAKLTQKKLIKKNKYIASYTIDKSKNKTIYLTFDDGPLPRGTLNVINSIRDEGVSATMFCVGRHISKRTKLFEKEQSRPSILIANHTYSHANGKYAHFYNSTKRVVSDINKAEELISSGNKYLRLAGRNVWRTSGVNRNDYSLSSYRQTKESPKYDTVSNEGYQIFGWDIEWNYEHGTGLPSYGAETMARRIESIQRSKRTVTRDKVILLAHDFMFRTAANKTKLKNLIRILRLNGWSFDIISNYTKSPRPNIFTNMPPNNKSEDDFRLESINYSYNTCIKKSRVRYF